MKPNIIEIDGRHYLELPCRPGDVVYQVAPHISSGGPMRKFEGFLSELRVYPIVLHDLDSVIRSIRDFGKTIHLTAEAAEEYKTKLESGELED